MIRKLFIFLKTRGDHLCNNLGEKKFNHLLNASLIGLMIAIFLIVITSWGIYAYLIFSYSTKYESYLIPFFILEFGSLFFLISIYILRNIIKFPLLSMGLSLTGAEVFLALLAFYIGEKSYIHFSILVISLYFFIPYHNRPLQLFISLIKNVFIFGFVTFALQLMQPWYPLPDKVIQIIAYANFIIVALAFYVAIRNIWLQRNYTGAVLKVWNKIITLGLEQHQVEEEIKQVKLLNQLFLVSLVLMIVSIILALSITVILLFRDFDKYKTYIFYYILFPLLNIFVIRYLWKKKLQSKQIFIFEIVTTVIMYLQVVEFSLMLGINTGVHLFAIAFSPLAFVAYTNRIKKVFIFIVTITATFSLYYILYTYPPLFPLDKDLEKGLETINIYAVIITIAITIINLWRHWHVSIALKKLWHDLSLIGSQGLHGEKLREHKQVVQIAFILFIMMLSILSFSIYYNYLGLIHYSATIVLIVFKIFLIVFVVVSKYFPLPVLKILLSLSACLTIAALCIILGKDAGVHYIFAAIILVPFLIDSESDTYVIKINVSTSVILFTLFYFIDFKPLHEPLGEAVLLTRTIVFISLILIVIVIGTVTWRENNILRNDLEKEREKSDNLLLNILPYKVAQELKEKGNAEPELFYSVSVLFTDFSGFTRIAEEMHPKDLIKELDSCFSVFDKITEEYNLEKLKTIGDSYMAAGGIPLANTTHPIDCVLAALKIQDFMNETRLERQKKGRDYWSLRLGIHSGPLVAGVIGEKKFVYDVWGDTVNTASRMESSGAEGLINISSATYKHVQKLFRCKYRGKIPAKHKGEVSMYFVEGIKPKYSQNKDGRTPNNLFWDYYSSVKNAN